MATMRSVDDLEEVDLKEKKVLVTVDLDVPLDDNFKITDDTKILEALVTILYLIDRGAKVILSSHLGCPKGVTPKYSLKPFVPRLSELLGVEVKMANDCIGAEVEKMVAEIPGGGVLLLENVRFHKEEEKNDPEFAKKLASLADLYVNDAFGTAHRAHASTEGVAKYLKPSVAGFLMEKKVAEASAAAPGVFHVKPLMEDQNLEETRVQVKEDLYLQTKRKRREESSQLEIFFSDKDLQGELPHKGPLVISLKVGNCLVDKIIVDTGSSCNIMYLDAFKKFDFKEDLRPPPLNKREARSNGQTVAKAIAAAAAAFPIPRVLVVKPVRKLAFVLDEYQACGKRQRCEESTSSSEGVPPQLVETSFSDEDYQGMPPHKGPLVITLKMDNCQVDKILVDTGCCYCNIMYKEVVDKLGFEGKLRSLTRNVSVAGFNGAKETAKWVVTLGVCTGSKTVDTEFLVVNTSSNSKYNAILGTLWISEMQAIISIGHGSLKFPNLDGTATEEIRGDEAA